MREILNINQGWYFSKGLSEAPAVFAEAGEQINLPHTWNGRDGQDGGNDYFRGACCYARRLDRAELPAGEKIYLEINGASSSADVYLNGKRLAHHDGGYSTWRVDMTRDLG